MDQLLESCVLFFQNSQRPKRSEPEETALSIISIVGCVLSIICLLLCVATLLMFRYVIVLR